LLIHSTQMRSRLLILAAALWTVISTSQTPSHNGNSHHFESGLGFFYDIPNDLAIISSKQFDQAIREKALQQTPTGQETKSINCSQMLVAAENRDESKIIQVVASPQGCAIGIVTDKNLAQLGQYSSGEIAKRFGATHPEYATFMAGKHLFWEMRSETTPNPPRNPNHEIALLITYTPTAVIEFLISARTPQDLAALGATVLKFDDGAETQLLSADAFGK